MKADIHPKYEKATIECACGNKIETRSTVFPSMKVELCSACHPFYTGKQKFVDTAGRVDKFKARMEAAKANQKSKIKNQNDKSKSKNAEITHKDQLKEIKKELTEDHKKTEAPGEVTQEETSDVELVADSELVESTAKKELSENKESNSAKRSLPAHGGLDKN